MKVMTEEVLLKGVKVPSGDDPLTDLCKVVSGRQKAMALPNSVSDEVNPATNPPQLKYIPLSIP